MSEELDPVALRDAYDEQLRCRMPDRLPDGTTVELDGPVIRVTGLDPRGFVTARSLDGVPDLDALIAAQRDFYAARGQSVEWKVHGHDRPDLVPRLRAAGFLPEEEEMVMIGLAAPLADPTPPLPAGVRLREVTDRIDLDRIAYMETRVWREDHGFLADGLEKEITADPLGTTIVVAEREPGPGGDAGAASEVEADDGAGGDGPVLSAGWIRFVGGTQFATLWGGSTLPDWRGRGIYRALVGYRAALATARGFTHLEVDASPDSRPILQRCGFVPVTSTTPYVFRPNASPAPA
ncbi:MAG TPA: GNAT family N-acetyltransferase [Micromonosporaceae bacterium]